MFELFNELQKSAPHVEIQREGHSGQEENGNWPESLKEHAKENPGWLRAGARSVLRLSRVLLRGCEGLPTAGRD